MHILFVFLLRRWGKVSLKKSLNGMLKQKSTNITDENIFFDILCALEYLHFSFPAERESKTRRSHLMILPFLRNVAIRDLFERGRTDEYVNYGDADANGNGAEQDVKMNEILEFVPLITRRYYHHRPIF